MINVAQTKPDINSSDELMTVNEFCKYLKVSRVFLEENFLYRKDFPAFRLGRHWRIKSRPALEYIERKGRKIS